MGNYQNTIGYTGRINSLNTNGIYTTPGYNNLPIMRKLYDTKRGLILGIAFQFLLLLIIGLITLLMSHTPPHTELYQVRVRVCNQTQTLTVEARSMQEARQKALRAARANVNISITSLTKVR